MEIPLPHDPLSIPQTQILMNATNAWEHLFFLEADYLAADKETVAHHCAPDFRALLDAGSRWAHVTVTVQGKEKLVWALMTPLHFFSLLGIRSETLALLTPGHTAHAPLHELSKNEAAAPLQTIPHPRPSDRPPARNQICSRPHESASQDQASENSTHS